MMNPTLTDNAYEVVERIDRQKRGLKVAIMVFVLPALLCSASSAYFYIAYAHTKGGLSYNNIALVSLLAILCVVFLVFAGRKFVKFIELKNKLNNIETLEETIYKEVLHHAD